MNFTTETTMKLADELTAAARASNYWQGQAVSSEIRLVLAFFSKNGFVFGEKPAIERAILAREIKFDWMFRTSLDIPRLIVCGSSFCADEYQQFLKLVTKSFPE